MVAPVLTHRCWNHGERAAVARCVTCGRHFCRECVAEHDGRMTCAACLRREELPQHRRWPWARVLGRGLHTALAIGIVWWVFLTAGRLLLRLPSSFHEGTVWQEPSWEDSEGGP